MSLNFKQLTGLNDTNNIELGLGRLDIAPHGSNNLLPFGALEGTAEATFTRTGVDVKAGVPQAVIKRIITEEGATLKVTLLETSAQRVHQALALPDSQFVTVGGATQTSYAETIHLTGNTPGRVAQQGLLANTTIIGPTTIYTNENVGMTNASSSQAFTVLNGPILNVAGSMFLSVGGVTYSVIVANAFPDLAAAAAVTASTNYSLTTQPASPSKLRLTVSAASAWGTITINGKDALSNSITETVTFASNTSLVTTHSFASVDGSGIQLGAGWTGATLAIDGPDQLLAIVPTGTSASSITFGDNIKALIPTAGQAVLFTYRSRVISGEVVGSSDGTASQTMTLNYPSIVASSQSLAVGGVTWNPVASFTDQLPTATIYTIDNTTGVITFGNGTNGAIPANGAAVVVSYQPTTPNYVDGTDFIVDITFGNIVKLPGGSMIDNRDYNVTYNYVGVSSQVVKFGGFATVAEFHVQFTHPMLDGRFEIVELYRAVPSGTFNNAWNSTAVNSRTFDFTGLADINRPVGDAIGSYRVQSSAPFLS